MMTTMFGFFCCADAGGEPANANTAKNAATANDTLLMHFMYVLPSLFSPAKDNGRYSVQHPRGFADTAPGVLAIELSELTIRSPRITSRNSEAPAPVRFETIGFNWRQIQVKKGPALATYPLRMES
jgi:hypothetical protein